MTDSDDDQMQCQFTRTRLHHFQRHATPARLSRRAALKILGASNITEALEMLRSKKPAQLRSLFEKVYKAPTQSQNKRWLQRRLAEALRLKPAEHFPLSSRAKNPTDTPSNSSMSPRQESSCEQASRSPTSRSARTLHSPFLTESSSEHNLSVQTPNSSLAEAQRGTSVSFLGHISFDRPILALPKAISATLQPFPAEAPLQLPLQRTPSLSLVAAAERLRADQHRINAVQAQFDALHSNAPPAVIVPALPQVPPLRLTEPRTQSLDPRSSESCSLFESWSSLGPLSEEEAEEEALLEMLDPKAIDADMKLMPDGSMW